MKISSFRSIASASLAASILLLGGCGSSSSNDDNSANETPAAEQAVSIEFEAFVGTEALTCSNEDNSTRTYSGVGTNAETVSIKDFRFFVSEIAMVKADGTKEFLTLTNNSYQYQDANGSHVALLDFEDNTGGCVDRGNSPATYTTIVGNVPEGEYTSIEFKVGVPFDLNHIEFPDVEALNHSSMAWNWAAGRKFTKLEVQPQSDPSLVWNFHLGSTGCVDNDSDGVTDECTQPNRVAITYGNFNPETETVKIDFSALLSDNDVSQDLGGAKGCMSGLTDPECEGIFGRLGIDVSAANGVSNYDMHAAPKVFYKGVRD